MRGGAIRLPEKSFLSADARCHEEMRQTVNQEVLREQPSSLAMSLSR